MYHVTRRFIFTIHAHFLNIVHKNISIFFYYSFLFDKQCKKLIFIRGLGRNFTKTNNGHHVSYRVSNDRSIKNQSNCDD